MDPNAIITATVTELTKSFFSDLKKTSVDFFSKRYSYLFEDFSRYLEITYNKCNYVRTIINKDKSFEIRDIYVPGKFKNNNKVYRDIDIIQDIRDSKPCVILGFGGIGKTVFTKYLWISIFLEPKGKIPVYIELRKLNNITDFDIEVYIRRTISPTKEGVDEAVFEKFLEAGQFVLIFDGFDELAAAKKDKLAEDIINLSYEYPKNGFVVSSRHDDRFSSWQRFKIYKACSFEKEQVMDLIEKISYDRETKKKFVIEIINKKYDTYDTFLSTPLLTLMMLMTFAQFAEVPDKRHIFYRYAFMTLYSWHDSSKESFNREKQTGLSLDQFEKAFSIFSLISYLNRDLEFNESNLDDYISQVKKYVEFDYDNKRFRSEMMDTVNLLYRDGDSYLFTHRSFQEYFSAYAVVNYFQHKIADIIPRLNRVGDSVLGLMYEINRVVVDDNFIIPMYLQHKEKISTVTSRRSWVDVLRSVKFYYIACYRREKDGAFDFTIFGREIREESWNFISYLKSFMETQEEVSNFTSSSFPGLLSPGDLKEAASPILDSLDKSVDSVMLCFNPYDESITYMDYYDVSLGTITEDIGKTIAEGKSVKFEIKNFVSEFKEEASEIKSTFVTFERAMKKTVSLQKQKDKNIDDILM